MKNKVVTFGEVMLRFNPEGFMRISQVQKFEATLAGSESNAAVTLANLGVNVSYVTKVPDHDVGNIVFTEMRRFGYNSWWKPTWNFLSRKRRISTTVKGNL